MAARDRGGLERVGERTTWLRDVVVVIRSWIPIGALSAEHELIGGLAQRPCSPTQEAADRCWLLGCGAGNVWFAARHGEWCRVVPQFGGLEEGAQIAGRSSRRPVPPCRRWPETCTGKPAACIRRLAARAARRGAGVSGYARQAPPGRDADGSATTTRKTRWARCRRYRRTPVHRAQSPSSDGAFPARRASSGQQPIEIIHRRAPLLRQHRPHAGERGRLGPHGGRAAAGGRRSVWQIAVEPQHEHRRWARGSRQQPHIWSRAAPLLGFDGPAGSGASAGLSR